MVDDRAGGNLTKPDLSRARAGVRGFVRSSDGERSSGVMRST